MSTAVETTATKTFFGKIIAAIGVFFTHLLNGAKAAFSELSPDQQQALINAVNISQIIKEGYTKGEDYVVAEITTATGMPKDVVEQTILAIAKDAGVNTTSVQGYLDSLANRVQADITDNGWNSLFSDIAAFGATWLSTGSLNWVSLSMGLLEFVYQHFIASKKAA